MVIAKLKMNSLNVCRFFLQNIKDRDPMPSHLHCMAERTSRPLPAPSGWVQRLLMRRLHEVWQSLPVGRQVPYAPLGSSFAFVFLAVYEAVRR